MNALIIVIALEVEKFFNLEQPGHDVLIGLSAKCRVLARSTTRIMCLRSLESCGMMRRILVLYVLLEESHEVSSRSQNSSV